MYKEKCIQFCLGLLLISTPGFSASLSSPSGLLLAHPLAARPLAMGNAFSALADDESSMNTNPAGLVMAGSPRISGGHFQGLVNTSIESLAAVYPFLAGQAVGLQLSYLYDEDQRFDEFGVYQGRFTSANVVAGLGLATRVGRHFSLGLGVKGIHERYDDLEQTGLAADLGLQASTGPWRFGLHAQNLGVQIAASQDPIGEEGMYLPMRVALGVARATFLPSWQTSIQVTGIPLQERLRLALGSELWVGFPEAKHIRMALRAGYQYDLLREDVGRLSVGAGLSVAPYIEINYALVNFGLLGTTHRFSAALTLPRWRPKGLPGNRLKNVYGLKVVPRPPDGVLLQWDDPNGRVDGYHIYTDFGHYDEQLTEKPLDGRTQRFIEVVRGQTYNFFVAPIGSDGQPGPVSEVLTWTAP